MATIKKYKAPWWPAIRPIIVLRMPNTVATRCGRLSFYIMNGFRKLWIMGCFASPMGPLNTFVEGPKADVTEANFHRSGWNYSFSVRPSLFNLPVSFRTSALHVTRTEYMSAPPYGFTPFMTPLPQLLFAAQLPYVLGGMRVGKKVGLLFTARLLLTCSINAQYMSLSAVQTLIECSSYNYWLNCHPNAPKHCEIRPLPLPE